MMHAFNRYHSSYLTDGCWSPTRPGVFFTTKSDGSLDIWDYMFKQNDPTLTIQVSDCAQNYMRVESSGKYVASGGVDGSTTLFEICSGLYQMQPNEKQTISASFFPFFFLTFLFFSIFFFTGKCDRAYQGSDQRSHHRSLRLPGAS